MDVKNSDRFLSAFNRIERALSNLIDAKEHYSFGRLLDLAKRKNAIVRDYEGDLRNYAELRNAIVHNEMTPDFVIAEPHISVVEKIEKIDQLLTNPKLVGEVFKKDTIMFEATDILDKVLKVMRQYKYTQYPVYENNSFRGLLTTTGVSYWLAATFEQGILPEQLPTAVDILEHEKSSMYYQFIRATRTLFEAEELFKEGIEHGHQYQALLITQNGDPHEPLIGMITPLDVMVENDR